jgi:Predicted ABC-type transport system involved in lysophospholipase L1 biosynthesis, permease component
MVIEFSPIEDCTPNESVQVEIKKILSGYLAMEGATIWFCEHDNENPQMIYSNKTYVARITKHGWQHGQTYEAAGGLPQGGLEYCPVPPSIDEYDIDGTIKKDWLEPQANYYELNEGFYQTDIGKRYQEISEALPLMEHIQPVTGTNKTLLLMPFYNKEAFISTGRDISDEEYTQGENVCLVPKDFAKANNLTIGDMVNTNLCYTNENNVAAYNFGRNGEMGWGFDLIGVGGVYAVFEEAKYKIVGIYEAPVYTPSMEYSMGGGEIVVPIRSIKNRDSKNIVDYGPMRGSNTSFQIPNGTIPQFMEQWEKHGNKNVEITFYDMGYSQLQSGIKNMKSISLLLLVIGLLMIVSILLFYSNIFITKQQGRLATMRCLGISKKECRILVLSGLMVIVIIGSIIGSSVGAIISKRLSTEDMSQDYYSNHYSNISAVDDNEIEIDNNGATRGGTLMASGLIIALGFAISLAKVNKSLKSEPMQLLSEKREE